MAARRVEALGWAAEIETRTGAISCSNSFALKSGNCVSTRLRAQYVAQSADCLRMVDRKGPSKDARLLAAAKGPLGSTSKRRPVDCRAACAAALMAFWYAMVGGVACVGVQCVAGASRGGVGSVCRRVVGAEGQLAERGGRAQRPAP